MKKKRTIILLLCSVCLAICACNGNAFDEIDQPDSTELQTDPLVTEVDATDSTELRTDNPPRESDQPEPTETNVDPLATEVNETDSEPSSTSTQQNEFVEQPEGDRPSLYIGSENDYVAFLNSTELPSDFVSYDEIDAIGAFSCFIFLSDAYIKDYSEYMYVLIDSEGIEITLYVDHEKNVWPPKGPVLPNGTNMRLLSNTDSGAYDFNGLVYEYLSGKLLSISWEIGDIYYTLYVDTPMLSDYPLTESTFVGRMLNSDTALQAVNTVFDNVNQNAGHSVPSPSVSFFSMAGFKDFLDHARVSAAHYEEFVRAHHISPLVTQEYAQDIRGHVERADLPFVISDKAVDRFSATYYLDRNELDMIYLVEGIRYRFVYRYDETAVTDRTASPILKNQRLGAYTVDLYQGEDCFVGELVTNSAVVQIVVYTENETDVMLNAFGMEALSDAVIKEM